MKLHNALKLFLDDYDKASTRRAYSSVLEPLIREIGPGRPVQLISNADIHSYIHDLDPGLAPATVRKHVKSIKTFFNWLVLMHEIDRSPAATLKQRRLDPHIDKSLAAADEEVAEMLHVAYGDPRAFALISFLADTGCRIGGAATLRVENVSLENLEAVVTEKGDKTRPVWYSSETASALRRWIIRKPAGDFVFCRSDGLPMTSPSLAQVVRRVCVRAGLRSLGPHSLRHRKGHQLSDAGISPTIAAAALGHSDPTVTMQFYYPHDYNRAQAAIRATHEHDIAEVKIKPKIVQFPAAR